MKKATIVLFSIGGFIVALFIILSSTHTLQIYHLPTTANQPTYRPGDILIASDLKTVNNNDFVVFKGPDKVAWIFRCIGKEGDVVEIRNAEVYLNEKLLNEPFAWNEYYISKDQLLRIEGFVKNNKNPIRSVSDSLLIGTFTTAELKEFHLSLKRCTAKDSINPGIFTAFKKTRL